MVEGLCLKKILFLAKTAKKEDMLPNYCFSEGSALLKLAIMERAIKNSQMKLNI